MYTVLKRVKTTIFTVFLLFGFVLNANALTIDSDALRFGPCEEYKGTAFSGAGNPNVIPTLLGDPDLGILFKWNAPATYENYPYKDSYLVYYNPEFQATINYQDGPYINTGNYEKIILAIQDGIHWGWYWDITDLWDGKTQIYFNAYCEELGFTQGAISNIVIWGTGGVPVPEPSTLLLLGIGIIGVAFCARRRMKD
jgi:hypothetical protein